MGAPYRLLAGRGRRVRPARGLADVVLIGADRIAANGDTANKIGGLAMALAARHAGVPLLVIAPETTIDRGTPHGGAIEIEERGADEVTSFGGVRSAPEGTRTLNPAFDVTPAVPGHGHRHRPTGDPDRPRRTPRADAPRPSRAVTPGQPSDQPDGSRDTSSPRSLIRSMPSRIRSSANSKSPSSRWPGPSRCCRTCSARKGNSSAGSCSRNRAGLGDVLRLDREARLLQRVAHDVVLHGVEGQLREGWREAGLAEAP